VGNEEYVGYDKVVKEALVSARGQKALTNPEKILALEHKLETAKLSHVEIAEIQKQLKQLRSR
jgi:hypothetical protein